MKKLFWISLLSIVLLGNSAAASFVDVKNNNKNKTAIEYMQNKGIINGYAGSLFKPKKEIRRSELAKIIVKAIVPEDFNFTEYQEKCFRDVQADDWFAPYACYAKEQNWLKGYEGDLFRPEKTITRAEALKVVLSAFCISISDDFQSLTFSDVSLGDWYMPYVETASNLMILEEDFGNFNPTNKINRGYLSQIIYNLVMLKNEHYNIEDLCDTKEKAVSGEIERKKTEKGFDQPI